MENTNTNGKGVSTKFAKSYEGMVAANDAAYAGEWTRQYRKGSTSYKPEEIENIINSGSVSEKVKLSQNYFRSNGFYKRIVLYYATLFKYSGILIPNPKPGQTLSNKSLKRYNNALDFLEVIKIKSFCTNCALRAIIDGTYYGIIQQISSNTFSIMDLPSQYCDTRYKDFSGNDIIEFDLKYFDTIADEKSKNKALAAYPKFVANAYAKWKKGKLESSWIYIPSDVGICFPFYDGTPFFLNIIPATIFYNESVEIERERELEEIRKIIVQKVPHLNDGTLLFEPVEAEDMHRGAVNMMKKNPNVSVLTTYTDVDAIISKATADNGGTSQDTAIKHIYQEAGTSQSMFSSDSNLTLIYAVKNDMALMAPLVEKMSNFLTNIINALYSNGSVSFKYEILPVSCYTEKDYVDQTFKLAQSGFSFLIPSAAMDLSQKDLIGLKSLENDVLKLHEKLLPLKTSYTQSGDSGAVDEENKNGAPVKNPEDMDEKTEAKQKVTDK